jgi:hypothetical protein
MPKERPDRDDSRGGLGAGGPQDGPINTRKEQPGDGDSGGEGSQRHPGGSSRDPEPQD